MTAMTTAMPRTPMADWDEHRNTSRVFAVPPDALPTALRAFATIDPALRRWIEDGHPNLTETEHFQRFGASYEATRSRKPRAREAQGAAVA